MTCKEKLKLEHPDDYEIILHVDCPISYEYLDDPSNCNINEGENPISCEKCWEREIPDSEEYHEPTRRIKDSGERREFETGAVRDICEGKGRCDLMPLDVVGQMINLICGGDKIFSVGYVVSDIHEFQCSGMVEHLFSALHAFILIDSVKATWPDIYTTLLDVAKHFEEGAKKYGEYNWQKGIPTHCYIDSAVRHYLKFLRGDKDEPHDRAFVWNIMCCIWTCTNKPELNDYPRRENDDLQREA